MRVPDITAVACARSALCLAGARQGYLFASRNPLGGAQTFSHIRLSKNKIIAVACQSQKLCVVIDDTGRAWVSKTPAGRASTWHPATLTPRQAGYGPQYRGLSAVACAPTTFCLAGDASGEVFTGS